MACSGYSEPQKMASFLKDRCDQQLYGLFYSDSSRRCICIPWPTVPKPNDPVPLAFEMFKEWAVLSFKKRGNTTSDADKEGHSMQKHRFRNALSRADGLKHREDIHVEGCKVYELPSSEYNKPALPIAVSSYYQTTQQIGSPYSNQSTDDNSNMDDNVGDLSAILEDINFETDQNSNGMIIWGEDQAIQGPGTLKMQLRYRGDTIMNKIIHDQQGFRLYAGNNIPDMSKFLGNGLTSAVPIGCKYPIEYYYGPENFLQIQMPDPAPVSKNEKQLRKTTEVVNNMSRGFIILLEYSNNRFGYNPGNIPDVYGIRLCQTRIFPFECMVGNSVDLKTNGLNRLEKILLFDSREFQQRLSAWQLQQGQRPSTTMRFSIGQKPLQNNKTISDNFVTLEMTVSAAETQLIHAEEVCPSGPDQGVLISMDNSMDNEAKCIEKNVLEAISFQPR